jgi:hypothetical protein
MTDVGTYTPLKRIVSYALDQVDKSIADFDKCWILAFRAMVDLTLDISGEPTTVRLPVMGNKTVPFPSNCLSWSKIGILDDKGQINTLKINNALTTYRDNNPNRLEDLSPNINNSIGSLALVPYYSNYYYGGGVYQLFGVGGGLITYGDCKVDDKNRVVILQPDFKYDSIMFEFIDCPEKNGDYEVFTCIQEAVIAFILWKLKLGTSQDYYAESIKARRRLPKKKFILQSFNEVIRASESMKLRS